MSMHQRPDIHIRFVANGFIVYEHSSAYDGWNNDRCWAFTDPRELANFLRTRGWEHKLSQLKGSST